jgi:hypothetical protein
LRNLTCAAILLLTFLASATFAATEQQRTTLKTLQLLDAEGFMKNASCTQVANTFLMNLGFPAIGESSPMRLNRKTFDRSHADEALPHLKDSGLTKDIHPTSIQISTHAAKGAWWIDLLRESASKRRLMTHLKFSTSANNDSNCDNLEVTFNAVTNSPIGDVRYSLENCLGILSIPPGIKFSEVLQWERVDCATALHFSRQAKTLLSQIK